MRGQGSVEYMSIVAIVIAFSVILISLVLNQINTSSDSMVQESKQYWAKKVPISILDWRQKEDGEIFLILKNKGLNSIIFYNISLDGYVIGEQKQVSINGEFVINGTTHSCNKGDLLEYTRVTIYYSPKGSNSVIKKSETHPIRVLCG